MNIYNLLQSPRQGWQCPVCRKVWNPDIPSCDCHKQNYQPSQWKTYGNTTTITVSGVPIQFDSDDNAPVPEKP